MEDAVSFAKLDLASPDRFVTLRRDLGVTSFGLNLVLLRPGQRMRIHRHVRQEEVYLVLEGTLTLLVEGTEHTLPKGELARVAPSVRRQLVNAGPDLLAILAVGGAEEHVGRDGEAFESWDDVNPRPPQEIPLPEDLPAT
jgi:uncharacterized cupin superfamily protein